jgi:hypothetical protein
MAWRFYLVRSSDMARLGEFTKIKSRQLSVKLNQSGSFQADVSMDDPSAALINPGTTGVQAVQDGVTRWSGVIVNAQHRLNGADRNIAIQATGWFDLLNHRVMRDNTVDYQTNFIVNPSFEGSITNWHGLDCSYSTTQHHTGVGSCLISRAAAGTGASFVQIDAGVQFNSPIGAILQMSFWVWVPTLANVNDVGAFVNQGGTTVAKLDDTLANLGIVSNAQWYNFTLQWVGDGSTTYIGMNVGTNVGYPGGGAAICYFDDAYVTQEQGVWGQLDIGETAQRLVDYANLRWPCPVTRGVAQPAWPLSTEYRPFMNIGAEIKRLSDVENGFDFEVDPATRRLNTYWPMKGSFKTRYDNSLRAHQKMGAEHLWQFDTTQNDADSISGAGLFAQTGTSSVAGLQSYAPGDHAVQQSMTGGLTNFAYATAQTMDMAMGANFAISLLAQISALPSAGKHVQYVANSTDPTTALLSVNVDANGALQFQFSYPPAVNITSPANTIKAGITHHIVACYDANQQRGFLYCDGSLVASTGPHPPGVQPAAQTGATASAGGMYETGGTGTITIIMDEVGYWRGRTISAVEVYHLFNVLRVQTGREIESVKFGYGSRGPSNLASISKSVDATWMTNFYFVQGKGGMGAGAAVALDLGSMVTYGEWDESNQISESNQSDVISAYAMGEVALRGRPRSLYTLKPMRTPSPVSYHGSPVPRPFIDYTVGDVVSFDARDGTIDIQSETARIFGITISFDDAGNEDVTLETALGGN